MCPAVNLINIFLYGVKLILYLCSFCDVIVVNNSDDDKSNLPFSVVDQMAGAATRAPERSPHGLHKI